MNEAGPAAPVEVLGLQGTPAAGDDFIVVADENQAKEVTGYRIRKERDAKLVKSAKSAMEQMLDKIKSGEVKHLPVIIKADVQGSIEAIEGTITKLSNDEVSVQILHSAVGPISDSDVTLAKASNAFIIGFTSAPFRMPATWPVRTALTFVIIRLSMTLPMILRKRWKACCRPN